MKAGLPLLILLCWDILPGTAAEGPVRFAEVSQASGMAMKHRSQHSDGRVANAQKNFEDVYASGYYWKIQDVCFADVNGDGKPDVFMLNAPHCLWSRLWMNEGGGKFQEIHSERLCPIFPWGANDRLLPFNFPGTSGQSIVMTAGDGPQWLSWANPEEKGLDKFRMKREYTGTGGYTHLLSDFDGDGIVDFATGVVVGPGGDAGGGYGGALRGGTLVGEKWELDRTIVALPLGAQCVAADFDNDGRTDILSRGHWTQAGLLRNLGHREFADATNGSGLEKMPGGGPVAAADFNNDGLLDIYGTGAPSGPKLYLNVGGGKFEDRTEGSGLVPKEKAKFTERFGMATAADFDNDGLVDIFVGDGKENRLFRNLGAGKFQDVTKESGVVQEAQEESGNAAGDFDGDGLVDLVVITPSRGIGLLRNASPGVNGWLKVKLQGPRGNPEGAGARVAVYQAGKLGQKDGMLGYQENIFSSDFRIPNPLHFGLGQQKTCDVRVVFPGGKAVEKQGVQAGTVAVISF